MKYEKKNVFEQTNKYEQENMYKYVDEYIKFLDYAKTEYKCVEYIVRELEENGFVDISNKENLNVGDKVS